MKPGVIVTTKTINEFDKPRYRLWNQSALGPGASDCVGALEYKEIAIVLKKSKSRDTSRAAYGDQVCILTASGKIGWLSSRCIIDV